MNADVVVRVWVAVTAVGAVAGCYGIYDAVLDIRALAQDVNGRRLIARSNLRTQLLRTTQLAFLLAVGLMSLLQVPATVAGRRAVAAQLLIAVAALMMTSSVLDRVVKRRLLDQRRGEARAARGRLEHQPNETSERTLGHG